MKTLTQCDAECSQLARNLDKLKAEGKDKEPEYLPALIALRDACRERIKIAGLKAVHLC